MFERFAVLSIALSSKSMKYLSMNYQAVVVKFACFLDSRFYVNKCSLVIFSEHNNTGFLLNNETSVYDRRMASNKIETWREDPNGFILSALGKIIFFSRHIFRYFSVKRLLKFLSLA